MSRGVRARTPSEPAEAAKDHAGGGLLNGLVRTARPRHWIKNLLVFAAPGAAGVLGHSHDLLRSIGAFAVFCCLASGTYFINDAIDAPADRHHPVKRLRPVAAGTVPVRLAVSVGVVLLVAGLAGSLALGWRMLIVSASYVAIQFAYSIRFKHEPIFDLACVASGFVLRAIAGGVAVMLPISQWFLIVATFGSLLMVTGKRYAEHLQLGDRRGSHRRSLDSYSEEFLRGVMHVSAAVAMTAYCLWAFERETALHHHQSPIFFQLSIVPFILGILRYAYLVDTGHGGQPERIIVSDRTLQLVAVVWIALFALGVYAT
jgi:decaprenyl-phosphate phosphoribosyltransferase